LLARLTKVAKPEESSNRDKETEAA